MHHGICSCHRHSSGQANQTVPWRSCSESSHILSISLSAVFFSPQAPLSFRISEQCFGTPFCWTPVSWTPVCGPSEEATPTRHAKSNHNRFCATKNDGMTNRLGCRNSQGRQDGRISRVRLVKQSPADFGGRNLRVFSMCGRLAACFRCFAIPGGCCCVGPLGKGPLM